VRLFRKSAASLASRSFFTARRYRISSRLILNRDSVSANLSAPSSPMSLLDRFKTSSVRFVLRPF
jgi:hypothetical protein